MRSALYRSMPLASILMLLAAASSGYAQEYKVVLDRPEKVGQTYQIHGTGKSTQSVTVNVPGAPPQKEDNSFSVQLDGTIKVLEVGEKTGEPTKIECTVSKCTKDEQSIVDAGSVITAETKEGKTAFTMNGMPVEPPVTQALEVILEVHQPGTPSNGAVFGTDQPQKVGATWPINAEAAAVGAAKSGLPVSKDAIKGEAKLIGVKEVEGKKALEIAASMNVANLSGNVPEGKIDSGSITAQISGLFPVDETAQPLSSNLTLTIHMKMTVNGPGGQSIGADTDVVRSNQIKYGPAEK
jgi:hypothetical protein